jgi:hypothetical protein
MARLRKLLDSWSSLRSSRAGGARQQATA